MNLIIVDDHPVTQFGIELIIKQYTDSGINLSGTYTSGQAFLEEYMNKETDLVLIDLQLPDMSGFELIAFLKSVNYQTKIGVYTSYFNRDTILKAIKNKANGIISKAINADDFIEGMERLLNKDEFVCIGENVNSIEPGHTRFSVPKNERALTKRESEILQLMREGLKNKEIAQILNISLSTVEFHRKNLYQKFQVKNLGGLLKKITH